MIEFDKYKTKGAYHYEWYNDPNWAWYKQCVDRTVDFCKGSTLDIGCGDGLISKCIAENGYRVTGIDNSPEGIKLAKEKSDKPLFLSIDIEEFSKLSSENANVNFEYMVCLNTIEHLKNPECIVDIFEKNITKAAIIITDEAREDKGRYHEHEFTQEELNKLFDVYDFVEFKIDSTEFGKPISFIGIMVFKETTLRSQTKKVNKLTTKLRSDVFREIKKLFQR